MTDYKNLSRQQGKSCLTPVLQAIALTVIILALLVFVAFGLPSMIMTAIDTEMDNRSAIAAAAQNGGVNHADR